MKSLGGLLILLCCWQISYTQDSSIYKNTVEVIVKNLPDITIVGSNSKSDIQQMPDIVGTSIYAGKKNSLIVIGNVQGNIVNNTMRQVLAKVAGIHVWESDASGIQIGIAARGLSPNRSWDFNVRQNGYDISADPFGYPEAYYNPQLQGVQRIEIIRGQGALQYGPQFGGMINYILKNGSEINKSISFETAQSIGSNGMFNTFNAIGGRKNKVHYYSFFDHRNGNGWRNNSQYFSNAGFGTITYAITPKLSITAETMLSHTRSQQAGGLTDVQFNDNPQQSSRSRNWFDIEWVTPAVIFNYTINKNSRWNTKLFATIGNRNSIGFMTAINIPDSINLSTLDYNNRTLNADTYRNYAIESRLLLDYSLGKKNHVLSAGIKLYTGSTHRYSNGKGTTGKLYEMTLIGKYPNDIRFTSNNAALFIENMYKINKKLLLIPGIRYEWLNGKASGQNGYNIDGSPILLQNITKSRDFLLSGIGAEYHCNIQTEWYANITQAYRPIQFANLQAPPSTDKVDPNLKDAKGYNIDLGYRGKIKQWIKFDCSIFYLNYKNRIGTIIPAGESYRLITNVGNSSSKGVEAFIEVNAINTTKNRKKIDLRVFSSYSYTNAKYSNNHKDASTKGKWVENAPLHILRAGWHTSYQSFLFTTQWSYVDKTFSDANNTRTPTPNGQTGLIPAYTIIDCSAQINCFKFITLKTGLNNVFNTPYFTRRAGGYPGPGVLPGDGRNYFVTLSALF